MSIKKFINSYEPETKEIQLSDTLKVVFVEANFDKSLKKFKESLGLLNGALKIKTVVVDGESKPDIDFDITAISDNLSSPKMDAVEQFIRGNCKLFWYKEDDWHHVLSDEMSHVFGQEDGTYVSFIFEGIKFHFVKHLPSGNGLLGNLVNQAVNKMHMENLKPTT